MSTIKQKSVVVTFDGGSIEVRRMKWKPLRDFLRKIGAAVMQFAQTASASGEGAISLDFSKLQEIIGSSDELMNSLCLGSTDLKPAELDELDGLVASQVLKAALEVNMDDELKNCWADIVRHVTGIVSAKAKTS